MDMVRLWVYIDFAQSNLRPTSAIVLMNQPEDFCNARSISQYQRFSQYL